MKHYFSFLFLLFTVTSWACDYNRTPYQMEQPDGTSVTVFLYGNDYYLDAESMDQYTLTRDEKTHEICYALLSADGNDYASSGIVYKGTEAPEGVKMLVQPGIRINAEKRAELQEANKKILHEKTRQQDGPHLRAATVLPDTVWGVCVLVDFPETKSALTRDEIDIFFNSDDQTICGNKRSIKKYFQWISNGKLTYINYIPKSFYTAPNTKEYYAPSSATEYTTLLFLPVVEQALKSYTKEKDGFDVTDLSVKDGCISAINILYAGTCNNQWATGLWPHANAFQMDLARYGFSPWVWHNYQISDIGSQIESSTFVHENGHMVCGWPDFYTYEDGNDDNNAKPYNIGDSFWQYDSKAPSWPNAWALDQVGWLVDKVDLTDIHDGRLITLKEGPGSAAVYHGSGSNSNEAFYLEVRPYHHKNYYPNQDKGIFIWHSNSKGNNNYSGYNELLDCRPATEANPFWVKNNGPSVFDDNSYPNARWVDGNSSGIYLWDFSEYGETMTFRCGPQSEETDMNEITQDNASQQQAKAYCDHQGLHIECPIESIYSIYTAEGILIDQSVTQSSETLLSTNLSKGTYLIVRIQNSSFLIDKSVRVILQ